MCAQPQIGTRLALSSHLGTIRYIGTVTGYTGEWLGVEWDDPSRGKHDGTKDGTRFFACRAPGTPATFIRKAAAGLTYGVTFLVALTRKYVDLAAEPAGNVEEVVLGSSGGAIVVEAPRLSGVRQRLARLDTLRVASLDGEFVSSHGSNSDIALRALKIDTLDLSRNLLATWDVVLHLIAQLPHLRSLTLNDNRLEALDRSGPHEMTASRQNLTLEELRLNHCLVSVDEIWTLGGTFPGMKLLELADNLLVSLDAPASQVFRQLETLNLASNAIADWTKLILTIRSIPTLQHLILAENQISRIPSPEDIDRSSPPIPLRVLSLSSNKIRGWGDLDAVSTWFPSLESLYVQDNPIMEDPTTADYSRQFVIARFPELKSCDGSQVSSRERKESELYYLSFIAKTVTTPNGRAAAHPRWPALCQKYGAPDEVTTTSIDKSTLGSRMIDIYVLKLSGPPAVECAAENLPRSGGEPPVDMKVLPSMTLKTLRAKILKALKIRASQDVRVHLWALLHRVATPVPSHGVMTLEMDLDGHGSKEIDFWGLESGSGVGVLIE